MKKITIIIILLSCIPLSSFSQHKTELRINTEGSWFMPYRPKGHDIMSTKSGFGTGIGINANRTIFWRFSTNIGITYRYKQMQQFFSVTNNNGDYNNKSPYTVNNTSNNYKNPYGSMDIEGWDKLPMHYIVIPIHLQILLSKSFFIGGGIESTWLLNYKVVNEKPEFNWTIGFGSQKHKLKWSLNYIKGFKEQGFSNKNMEPEGYYKGSINTNNMLLLKLSYPIGQLNF